MLGILLVFNAALVVSTTNQIDKDAFPKSPFSAMLHARDVAHIGHQRSTGSRAAEILTLNKISKPRTARARTLERPQLWHCCPPYWFNTKFEEVRAEVFLVRPYKVGSTTLQTMLWHWAIERSIPIVNHLDNRTSPAQTALYDARLAYPDFARFLRARRGPPLPVAAPSAEEPVFVCLLRAPLERAVALFYWAHRKPEAVGLSRGASPRGW